MLPSQSDWVQVPMTHENTLLHHVFDRVQTLEPGQVLRYRPESEGYAHYISMDQLGHYVLTHHRVVGHKSFVHEDPDDNYVHPLTIAWLDETDHPYHFHHYRHSLDHTSITTGTVPDFLDYCLKTIETLSDTPYKVLANVWHYRPTINMVGKSGWPSPFKTMSAYLMRNCKLDKLSSSSSAMKWTITTLPESIWEGQIRAITTLFLTILKVSNALQSDLFRLKGGAVCTTYTNRFNHKSLPTL